MMPQRNRSARVSISRNLFKIILVLLVLPLGITHLVLAQESTGTIVGQVTEASGAVIPNAGVNIKNLATNAVRTVTTGASGEFNVPFLAAGRYTITVEAPGFQSRTLEGITLEVGQTARVDTQLKVGTVSEIVQVDSVAVRVLPGFRRRAVRCPLDRVARRRGGVTMWSRPRSASRSASWTRCSYSRRASANMGLSLFIAVVWVTRPTSQARMFSRQR